METSDWINLIAAILVGGGTLTLAVMAWKSIRQTRRIQKAEKRERLLNEIIEWAIDISKWRPKEIHKDLVGIRDKVKRQELIDAHIAIIMDSLIEMRGRNQYVISTAVRVDRQLGKAIHNLIHQVEEYIELLAQWKTIITEGMAIDAVVDDREYFEKAEHREYELERHVNKVIKEAAKIKTRDIG